MIDGPVHLVGVEFVLESIKLMNELLELSIKGRVERKSESQMVNNRLSGLDGVQIILD